MSFVTELFAEDRDQSKPSTSSSEEDIDDYCDYQAEFPEDCSRSSRIMLPMDTIYESQEEAWACTDDESDDLVMVMNFAYSSDEPLSFNGRSGTAVSDSTGSSSALESDPLLRNIHAWSETSGLPPTVNVFVGTQTFKLHKAAMEGKSGLFKRMLRETRIIHLSEECCGGAEIFEIVANFCYTGTVVLQPSTAGVLRCAAEYLEMAEEHARGNLSQKCDAFLSHVALQSWAGSMAVLHQCQRFLTMAESLLLPSRCIDSLAFSACMDLERGRSSLSIDRTPWSDTSSCTADPQVWWMEDLASLPFNFFNRFVASVRRMGMSEEHIAASIERYAKRWIFHEENESAARQKQSYLLEAIVGLFPLESDGVRVSFLLALLRAALALNVSSECIIKLETRISSQLERATVEDLISPIEGLPNEACGSRAQVESIKHIVHLFMSQKQGSNGSFDDQHLYALTLSQTLKCDAVVAVSKLWDEYLSEIAFDSGISPSKFCDLVETVPSYVRRSHDQLYKAIHSYLKVHPHISQAERLLVCRPLNCQKLSQETCIHAVQNELMPLRMIVQAMFMHQLQRFKANYSTPPDSEASTAESLQSSVKPASSNRRTSSSYIQDDPFSSSFSAEEKELQEPVLSRKASSMKDEFEATKLRLRDLEAEMAKIKKNLQCDVLSKRSRQGALINESKDNFLGSCISHIWDSHRSGMRLTQRLSKAFHSFSIVNLLKGRSCHDAAETISIVDPNYHSESRKLHHHHPHGTVARSNDLCSAADTFKKPVARRHARQHSMS
ncbi:hypothetical protein O6H91_19G049100 [Diphasiastrum complanatum]|uniref:Uncharacterized protein n=1 Tax=Diphasiastrum complanatum TaxID=34168 RepID=A0ACC2AV06_DIPCM|nr:hypothetical protein O6H91_19G049100 [Diphasiastrum complanatum]